MVASNSSPEKKISINFTKANTKFCLSLHYNAHNGLLIYFLIKNKNLNLKPTQFCLGSISNGFIPHEPREVSLNGNQYDFSVDHNSIERSDL